MTDPQRWFVPGLAAHALALEALRRGPQAGADPGDVAAAHRIARSVRHAAEQHGHTGIAEGAERLAEAGEGTLAGRLDEFIPLLRGAAVADAAPGVEVLIADADPAACRFLEASLAAPGRRFHVAGSVADARRLLAARDIGLVLLDLDLPDQDGRELLVDMRSGIRNAMTPVIVLTGRRGTRERVECFALGCDEFIGKPCDPESLCACIAAQLQRAAEVSRWAWRDPLTELPNRSAMFRTFGRAREQAVRTGRVMSLALVDIDRLKGVNDTWGMAAGDEVLAAAAADLTAALREGDVAGRWDGEEFLVVMPGTAETGAVRVLQKALTAFRSRGFTAPAGGGEFQCTFSAGAVTAGREERMEDTVARAERALYLAKASGRNAVHGGGRTEAPERHALLVEDDDVMATVLTALLEAEGFRVKHFTDAEKALAAAEGMTCAFAVLDIRLPRGDGLEMLRSLRKLHGFARIPVVMVTGVQGPREVVRAFSLGADDYVAKPFSPAELQARIHRLAKEA